jgi:hypothetical protein
MASTLRINILSPSSGLKLDWVTGWCFSSVFLRCAFALPSDALLCSFTLRRTYTFLIQSVVCILIALMMEAVRTSETYAYFYETTQRHIPKGCHTLATLRTCNLKWRCPLKDYFQIPRRHQNLASRKKESHIDWLIDYVGWDWHLINAAITGLFFTPGWMWAWEPWWWWWFRLRLTPHSCTRAPWKSYYVNWSLTWSKILRHGTSGFTSRPKKRLLRIFIAPKNPWPRPCLNPRPLGRVTSTLPTTPPRRLAVTCRMSSACYS